MINFFSIYREIDQLISASTSKQLSTSIKKVKDKNRFKKVITFLFSNFYFNFWVTRAIIFL